MFPTKVGLHAWCTDWVALHHSPTTTRKANNNNNGGLVCPVGFWYFVYRKYLVLFEKRLWALFCQAMGFNSNSTLTSNPFFYGPTTNGDPKMVRFGPFYNVNAQNSSKYQTAHAGLHLLQTFLAKALLS